MAEQKELWLTDTGLVCSYDEEPIEYGDFLALLTVVAPTVTQEGELIMEPLMSDEEDYLYEPVFFHAPNWDRIEEQLEPYLTIHKPVLHQQAIIDCCLCKSSILLGETMGMVSFGTISMTNRCPYGIREHEFDYKEPDKAPICIECLRFINTEVHTIWPEGVAHEEECVIGTQTRCWRSGCPQNCEEEA